MVTQTCCRTPTYAHNVNQSSLGDDATLIAVGFRNQGHTKKTALLVTCLIFLRFEMIDAAKNRFRIKVCYLMIAATIGSCVLMIILGKQVSDSGWTHFIGVLCPLHCFLSWGNRLQSWEGSFCWSVIHNFFFCDRLQAKISLWQVRTWRRKQNWRRNSGESRKLLCLRRLSDEPSLLKPKFFTPQINESTMPPLLSTSCDQIWWSRKSWLLNITFQWLLML